MAMPSVSLNVNNASMSPDGFEGGLSAANYRTITDAAPATATRDLAELVGLGALRKQGELKRTRYFLNLGE